MAPIEDILGKAVLNGKNESVDVASFCGSGKIIGLYFSAHWCPPCRGFTPTLADFYNKLKDAGKADSFEIVFISSDRDEASAKSYFSEMPWLMLDYNDKDHERKAKTQFNITGIPTLIILNGDTGEVISTNGRGDVTSSTGQSLPSAWTK